MHNLKRLTRDETEHGNDYYLAAEVDKLIAAEQAASVQPVAWIDCKVQMPPPGVRVFFLHKDYDRVGFDTWCGNDFRWTPSHWMPIPPLTTTPPAAQRQWVGMTDEETDTEATQHEQSHGFIQGVQWANTKLKERNV